jgi:hypothetical protein
VERSRSADILTLNTRSSSLKFSLWHSATGIDLQELLLREVEKISIAPHLSAGEPGDDVVIDSSFGEPGKRSPRRSPMKAIQAGS